jgi:DnaK suppressor protein
METTHVTIRQQLEAQLDQLVRRVGRISHDLRAGHDPDWVESAAERANDEVLEGLDASSRLQVAAIRLALTRLDNGTYEECSECHRPIDPRRLLAMPTTTTCLNCSI